MFLFAQLVAQLFARSVEQKWFWERENMDHFLVVVTFPNVPYTVDKKIADQIKEKQAQERIKIKEEEEARKREKEEEIDKS